ncbi:hypothetical protein [Pedobacter antarcticus]|uniref:hypothetical protein n=1 Tax=Pedobacter antarcticus TaxID=34086 RepID=UPI001C5A0896|nr:hypothetical protein [Pedobacter antarcticus]
MRTTMNILLLVLLNITLYSCKKDTVAQENKPVEVSPPADTTQNPAKPGKFKIIDVGTGSGNLIIDGSKLPLQCNDHIRIATGSYENITIKNIESATGCAIVVTNSGLVQLNGNFKMMTLTNLKGVNISGDGDPKLKYGFQFKNNSFRSIYLNRPYNRTTIQHVSFENIKDYVITSLDKTPYDGTEKTVSRELKFLNIKCENTASFLQFSGTVENGDITGQVIDLEIANLDFSNSDEAGTLVWVGNVDGYNVHHNRVNNVNAKSNKHSGMFHMSGNGSFHDNYISNHQGNAIRAWTFSLGSTPKETLIYNNIVINSRKYSAFEVQSFENFMNSKVTYSNAKVFNNTCGNINMEKDWIGGVVDVYNLQGGTCKVFNNLGFNFPAPSGYDIITNLMSSTKTETYSNLYFPDQNSVGFADNNKFTLKDNSTAKNKGTSVIGVNTDYYGSVRNISKPSIGAVE